MGNATYVAAVLSRSGSAVAPAVVIFVLGAAALFFAVRPQWTARRIFRRYRNADGSQREPTGREVQQVAGIYWIAVALAVVVGLLFLI